MKIRTGFVSNSSSSSFCIYGICKSEDEIKEALIENGIATEEELEDGLYDYFDEWSYIYNLTQNGVSEEEAKQKSSERPFADFEVYHPYDDYYLGIPWSAIRDDETGAQFKKKIEDKMRELFGNDSECDTHQEAWHD